METFFFFLQKKDYQKSRVGTLLSQYSFGSQQQMAGIGDRGDGEKYWFIKLVIEKPRNSEDCNFELTLNYLFSAST